MGDVATKQLGMVGLRRMGSRGEKDFADEVLAAVRHGFGGHREKGAKQWGGDGD